MSKYQKFLTALMLAASLSLTACGEGWEIIEYKSTPYGNGRTAGTGVAYVLARMAPAKAQITPAPSLEPQEVVEEVAPAVIEKAPAPQMKIKTAEPVFSAAQRK